MKRHAPRLLATALLLAAATTQAAPPPTTLKQAYADAFLIGTAVNDRMVSGEDARAQEHIARQRATAPTVPGVRQCGPPFGWR